MPQAPQPFADKRFNAEGWNDKFGPNTFVPPTRNVSTASPSKTTRTNSKKPKQTKSLNGENVIVIDDSSDDDTFTWRGRNSQPNVTVADSPQAMDIDSPPPSSAPAADSPLANGVRNIPVEPSRPEWRSGDFARVDKSSTAPTAGAKKAFSNAVGSEDTEEFQASLADLKNVAPFAHQQEGLKSFGEMKDNLPFESKAAEEAPLPKVAKPQPLAFPEAPQAPRPPPTFAVSGLQPTVRSWEEYATKFEKYMQQWDMFHGLVTDHFATRKSNVLETRQAKGYDFLRRNEGDCLEYYKSVQQDNDVRRRWNKACEGHEEHLREFMAFREKMR